MHHLGAGILDMEVLDLKKHIVLPFSSFAGRILFVTQW